MAQSGGAEARKGAVPLLAASNSLLQSYPYEFITAYRPANNYYSLVCCTALCAGPCWLSSAGRLGARQSPPMASDSKNPFHVPSDEEVFALREEEAARKRQEREQAKELHVWEKGVKKNRAAELLAADPELSN